MYTKRKIEIVRTEPYPRVQLEQIDEMNDMQLVKYYDNIPKRKWFWVSLILKKDMKIWEKKASSRINHIGLLETREKRLIKALQAIIETPNKSKEIASKVLDKCIYTEDDNYI